MSDDIKVGDLVMVVRGHSCVLSALGGIPYTVDKVGKIAQGILWRCDTCGLFVNDCSRAYAKLGSAGCYPQSYLLKIGPQEVVLVEKEEGIAA